MPSARNGKRRGLANVVVSVLGKASEVVVENELCDEYRYKVRAEIGHGTNQHGAERYSRS